jgi:hypothetical protein
VKVLATEPAANHGRDLGDALSPIDTEDDLTTRFQERLVPRDYPIRTSTCRAARDPDVASR